MSDSGGDSVAGAKTSASLSPIMELNDEERKRWEQWEERDELSGRKAKKKQVSNGKQSKLQLDVTAELADPSGKRIHESSHSAHGSPGSPEKRANQSSPSSLDSSTDRIDAAQRRQEAQSKLLDHAKKAQQLNREQVQSILSTKTEETDGLSTALSGEEKSMGTTITSVQHRDLQQFSSMLRNGKVEVLKLNRHNKWQQRFITVSKETSWLKSDREPSTPTSSQCPQALLWYKGHNMKNNGLAGLKNDGKGGFMFTQLEKIERDPNVNPPAPIPKKLKAKFGTYAGVKIRYLCDDGERDLLFCFQDKSHASIFCTAIDIIRQVVLRNADKSAT